MAKILYKQPPESRIYTIIFEKNMDRTETITEILALTAVPDGLTVGSPETPIINGQMIQFRISGGDDGMVYELTARVGTSLGNILETDVMMSVQEGL